MTILGYHGFQNWRVRKEFGEDLERVFTFGIELEVTLNGSTSNSLTPNGLASKLENKFGDLFVYERDGSIGNGVEIISQPMTWKWFTNHLNIFRELMKICIESGFDSHKGNLCGLHVHIGREALGGIDKDNDKIIQSKVIANMNFILERFQKEIFKFSRRTSTSYSRWTTNRTELISIEGHNFIDKDSIREINEQNGTRYTALNLRNAKTVEYRFLRGTLKYETFFISMNFIKNMVEQSRISNHAITLKQLLMHGLNEEMQEYLKEYCSSRAIDLESETCNTVLFLENVKKEKTYEINKLQLANDILED